MTLRRLPDEDPQNLADPAYRRRRIIMQNMRDEELAIAQVEEMQAVSAVLKGKYTMTGEASIRLRWIWAAVRQQHHTVRWHGVEQA
ncbi:major head protein [Escherichia coli]|nr:major head protein [Escherichia coli]